jgi:hypothetical protein
MRLRSKNTPLRMVGPTPVVTASHPGGWDGAQKGGLARYPIRSREFIRLLDGQLTSGA